MRTGLAGSNWRSQSERRDENQNGSGDAQYEQDEMQNLRKLQFTVATSTFSVIAFIGLFCTCLWLGCCRHKRHSRIQGRTWNTSSNYAVPINTGGPMMGHNALDPNGLNPYLINTGYYADLNLNTTGGLYHPSAGLQQDEKPPGESTYRPFFAKVEWDPPTPPGYNRQLSFENPVYRGASPTPNTNNVTTSIDDKKQELIKEKVPTSILARCDPTKQQEHGGLNNLVQNEHLSKSDAPTAVSSNTEGRKDEGVIKDSSTSSAPSESLVSIESRDTGYPYPDGVNALESNDNDSSSKPQQGLEELTPPPYNPAYLAYTNKLT